MDIEKSFSTSSEPILYFLNQQGLGYYIPLYQRKYSWDGMNILNYFKKLNNINN